MGSRAVGLDELSNIPSTFSGKNKLIKIFVTLYTFRNGYCNQTKITELEECR